MADRFKIVDRDTEYLFPPSVQDWLPSNHLARFVVELVDEIDLEKLNASYKSCGSLAFHPSMMVALLFYGYATGVFSSRKLERATHDSMAFRYITANTYPDHDTIASFRRRFMKELSPIFVQILETAQEMGLLKLGTVSLDGTKVKANANKHKALSYGYAKRLESQLKKEVRKLMKLAESADENEKPDGMDIPSELERRETRLVAITKAKAEIERRAKERHSREKTNYEIKHVKRKTKIERTGKKPCGPNPKPPESGPKNRDQVNLTDKDSRIMLGSGKSFMQAYNAQAAVDTDSMLVLANKVSQNANDKKELQPILECLETLPDTLGTVENMLADAGYFSETNVIECEKKNITPYIASGREGHNKTLEERFEKPPPVPDTAGPVENMKHRLKMSKGKTLYAKRKSTVEPVFGIIKHVMGFRQFLLRGLASVEKEWSLVCMAWNIRRMHVLKA
ncbi:MAG: IS1182 family transposase [Nitrospinaceae bacterium]|nr:IS1182 family transposase [Nitrospina sp.]MBT5376594.1 IS1182 family transposase [Nitrospinaceae bacterium]MBT5548931.1 IS1182 family transposase [Nitrospina sp.]MBT5869629.1 IS1182 family transposase [Nitrospinaceae bacterium]